MRTPFGATLANLRSAMSAWASVQSITGTVTDAAALALIFQWGAPASSVTPPPRIILDAEGLRRERDTAGVFNGSLPIDLMFEIPIPVAEIATDHSQKVWFMDNVVDPILDDINDEPARDGGVNIVSHAMTTSPGAVGDRLPSVLEDMVLWVWGERIEVFV